MGLNTCLYRPSVADLDLADASTVPALPAAAPVPIPHDRLLAVHTLHVGFGLATSLQSMIAEQCATCTDVCFYCILHGNMHCITWHWPQNSAQHSCLTADACETIR